MIGIRVRGNFSKTENYFKKLSTAMRFKMLDHYGQEGVAALAAATPVDSGTTAASWSYKIKHTDSMAQITFHNSNINKGVPIAIILQYGHGTGTGGWVEGRDYINPAIQPIFDKIAKQAWEEVTKL